jgi:hypothetical protein
MHKPAALQQSNSRRVANSTRPMSRRVSPISLMHIAAQSQSAACSQLAKADLASSSQRVRVSRFLRFFPTPEPAVPAYRKVRMDRKRQQVLGAALNRSESSRWRDPAKRMPPFVDGCYGMDPRIAASICLDVSRADHFAPFLRFIGDELAEIGRRACNRNAAEVGETGLHL